MKSCPQLVDVTELPTPLGVLRGYSFVDADGGEIIAVVRGRVWGLADVALGLSANDGSPPSTALGAFENAVVMHFRPHGGGRADGVRRRGGEDAERLAVAHAIVRQLGVRSVRLVRETPAMRMEKR